MNGREKPEDGAGELSCVCLEPAESPEAMAALCLKGQCPCLGFKCPLGAGPPPCSGLDPERLAGMWRNAFGRMRAYWVLDRQIDLLALACADLDGVPFRRPPSAPRRPGGGRDCGEWLEWSRKESLKEPEGRLHLN